MLLMMTFCVLTENMGPRHNMNGELITSHVMILYGGHVTTLVGYNDLDCTKEGYTGG